MRQCAARSPRPFFGHSLPPLGEGYAECSSSSESKLELIDLQGFQHRLDARHFVGAEQIRFTQRGEDGEKWFGAADLLPEIFERMRQRLADRIPERAQSEAIQKRRDLMPHASGAVLQVPVI